jgi:hypothetical protein
LEKAFMPLPLVSVLMPVYNGQRYLREAVDSVLRQSFQDFEFVVIDDGSTDATPSILAEFRDPRLRVFSLPHAGLVQALNDGLARCSGDYVARMDADDISRCDRLAEQVEFLDSHPNVDVVECWCDLIDHEGVVVGCNLGGVSDDMILELAGGNDIVHGSIMVRRSSLPRPPVYVGPAEDYRLWVRMVREGRRFATVPGLNYEFRAHGGRYSLTHASSQSTGIVEVQWPLLEECSATRDLSRPDVRQALAAGWGRVAGAAYCTGDRERGDAARRQFLALICGAWDAEFAAAAGLAIEAMIWGGCPWQHAWRLRWLEWRNRPGAWASYRNLLLTLPPAQALRSLLGRDT